MSQIQQLISAVNSLTERLNQLESNSKRIFELPVNTIVDGLSKFAISRPDGVGEITEYITLNAILEWTIQEIQNIENATRLVQMLPPELLSEPRRIKIPVVDSEENDVPIVWKILGVQYVEDEEQIIEIPDAEENYFRKDLILGTQLGTVIRFAGTESTEGVIEPVQPENTVLLTSITVFGDTTYEEPEPPVVGSQFIKKMGYKYIYNESGVVDSEIAYPLAEDRRNYVILSWNTTEKISGFSLSSAYGGDTVYNGMIVTLDNQTANPVVLIDMGLADVQFDFRAGISEYTMKPGEVLTFKLRNSFLVLLSSNKAETDNITLEKARQNGNVLEGDVEYLGINQYAILYKNNSNGNSTIGIKLDDGNFDFEHYNPDNNYVFKLGFGGEDVESLSINSTNPNFKGLVGNEEFDKQGDRKAFAQIADIEDALVDFVPTSDVGVANGVAPTDSNNKIPLSFLPDAILGQVVFGGTVVPATGIATLSTNAKTKLGTTDATITLTNDTTPITGYKANEGIYYIAFDNGTFAGISLEIGDWLISTGSNWSKIDNTDAVTMVNGKTGAVSLNSGDIPYNNTTSELSAENAQDAFDELEDKKLDKDYLLDSSDKIKVSFLPNSVMTLEGQWNASTNTPTLTNGTGNPGDVYEVTVEGSQDFGGSVTYHFSVGDFVVYGADGKWYRSPNTFPTKEVVSVTSNITLLNTHKGKTLRFSASGITVTIPSGLDTNFEVFLDNDTASDNVTIDPSAITTVLAPSGLILIGGGTGYITMTSPTSVSIKGDFID